MTIKAENGIEAKSKKMNEVLYKKKYKVKYFQREYKWERSNIEDLLVDLERSFFSNYQSDDSRDQVPDYSSYYMGPIVLYREKTSYVIVDGQQRLTSFTLLMIYLKHLQNEILHNIPSKIQKLDEYVYSQPYENLTLNMEIPEREAILKGLFEGNFDETMLCNESSQNIYDRFYDIIDIFSKKLKRVEVLPVFISWLQEKIIFIEIMAQSSDSAYTIFESMNDRGLKLTQTELLKSYLLSNLQEQEIKELDKSWKEKIAILNSFDYELDEDFFKAWLRAKYAKTYKSDSTNSKSDFERIGNRFSNWVQDNSIQLLGLDPKSKETYFYFVYSDFHFYVDLYIRLCELANYENEEESLLTLMSYRGISDSLTYPLILSPIVLTDSNEIIEEKIDLSAKFIDCFSFYRMLSNESIAHNSVDNFMCRFTLETRNKNLDELYQYYKLITDRQRAKFLQDTEYISSDSLSSKYILSRIFYFNHHNIPFNTIYFQRKKDSFVMYPILSMEDIDESIKNINLRLKEILSGSLSSFIMIPKNLVENLKKMTVQKRIEFLNAKNYFPEMEDELIDIKNKDVKSFLIKRNKKLKEFIYNKWKI